MHEALSEVLAQYSAAKGLEAPQNGAERPQELFPGYRKGIAAGTVLCEACGAAVGADHDWTLLHDEWHEKQKETGEIVEQVVRAFTSKA